MQKRGVHSLLQLAGREVKKKAASEGGQGAVAKGRWVILPPVPAAVKGNGLLLIMQQPKQVSAIAWLKQCCPQISQNDAETLFRSSQVKICVAGSQAIDLEHPKVKEVTRKEILPEGSVLCLPKRSLQSLNLRCRGRRLNRVPESIPSNPEKDKVEDSEEEH